MSTMNSSAKTTLWIWPSGLFPRRLIYYFRAKGITMSMLKQHDIDLIPIELKTSPPELQSMAGYEPRPPNSSLPILRIAYPNSQTVWIRESLSILEYFEDVFPASEGWADLRGTTAEHRAQTRDVISLLSDAMHWSLVSLIHTNPSTKIFSGLNEEQMSSGAAYNAEKKFQFLLGRLERWVEDDVVQARMRYWTLAGLVLLSQVEYLEMSYGMDWVAEHGVLRLWVDGMKSEKWYVRNEELMCVERGEGWSVLLGG